MIFPDMLLPPVYRLNYGDFDKLVQTTFDWEDYEVVVDNEWNNDTDHLYTDITKTPKYEYDITERDRFINGDRKWIGVHLMLLALVYKDVIPEGNYIIEVSW